MSDTTPVWQLIQALRSPLPEGFRWDFRRSFSCALQVAREIGVFDDIQDFRLTISDALADPFCLPLHYRNRVVPLYGVPAREVTPAMVADALERLVAGREG